MVWDCKWYFASLTVMILMVVLTAIYFGFVGGLAAWLSFGFVSLLLNGAYRWESAFNSGMLVLIGPLGLATTIGDILDHLSSERSREE